MNEKVNGQEERRERAGRPDVSCDSKIKDIKI